MFFGTASLWIERISFSEIEAKREAILFLFGCSEVNSTWIITSRLANQRAPKALFTCVVYTNTYYCFLRFLKHQLQWKKEKKKSLGGGKSQGPIALSLSFRISCNKKSLTSQKMTATEIVLTSTSTAVTT